MARISFYRMPDRYSDVGSFRVSARWGNDIMADSKKNQVSHKKILTTMEKIFAGKTQGQSKLLRQVEEGFSVL
jgi:hypothetical protein